MKTNNNLNKNMVKGLALIALTATGIFGSGCATNCNRPGYTDEVSIVHGSRGDTPNKYGPYSDIGIFRIYANGDIYGRPKK